MALGSRTWYYNVDTELRLIHAFRDCSGMKVALKYSYSKEITVRDVQDAHQLDMLTAQGYIPCHTCWRREVPLAKKDGRRERPGFRLEPAKR